MLRSEFTGRSKDREYLALGKYLSSDNTLKAFQSAALAVLAAALALTGCRNTRPSTQSPSRQSYRAQAASAAQQSFDYYLLNLSWSPEFCYSHPKAVECSEHASFVLHGLWPQKTSGGYPENCSEAPGPRNPAQYSDLYPDPSLLRHEWRTHGTCSGLTPDAFFSVARKAVHSVTVPAELASLDHQVSMPPQDIVHLFTRANPSIPAGSLAISCGNNYLTAVEVCLSKSLQPIACGPIRSCRANTVRIPPPR
ncbi:MAG: ribonuclease T2 [Acidobacteriaceae bacterium]